MDGLTRDAFIEGATRSVVPVSLDGLGTCYIRELTGADRDHYEHFVQVTAKDNWENITAKLVQLSLCDADGTLFFLPSELDHVGALNGRLLNKIFAKAISLNGLQSDAIEDAEKKS